MLLHVLFIAYYYLNILLYSRMNCARLLSNDKQLVNFRLCANLFLFARKNCQNCLFTDIQTCDIDKSRFVINEYINEINEMHLSIATTWVIPWDIPCNPRGMVQFWYFFFDLRRGELFSFGNNLVGTRQHIHGICLSFGQWYVALE